MFYRTKIEIEVFGTIPAFRDGQDGAIETPNKTKEKDKKMKKENDDEMKNGQAGQELAETPASNAGPDEADKLQTDDLRAYAPAGAAMAPAAPQDEEGYHEDEGYEDESSETEDSSGSAADTMRDYAEQDFIDDTVEKINSMYRKNVDNGKIEIGEYLLDELFKGNIEQAMSTNPQKHKTFSKIISRTDLLVEPKTLGSWVRAAAAMKDLQKRGINLPSLTTYQYVELATVRDEKERTDLAKRAELKRWSVKALREEIRKAKGREKSEVDKLKEDMEKGLRQYTDLAVDKALKDFASDVDSVKDAYPPEKAMKLLPDVKKVPCHRQSPGKAIQGVPRQPQKHCGRGHGAPVRLTRPKLLSRRIGRVTFASSIPRLSPRKSQKAGHVT